MSHWIEWSGGECPVDPEFTVEVKTRNGEVHMMPAEKLDWGHGPYPLKHMDIIAYRVQHDSVMTEEEEALPAREYRNKYMREIKPGVWVDVYDVLDAWAVRNPALQHLIKKALAPGQRGHKTLDQDMSDIVASAERARELEK